MKENELLEPFKKICPRCVTIALIPNGHDHCLSCLELEIELRLFEGICLQCGQRVKALKEKKFCLGCLGDNALKFRNNFIENLSVEQIALFEEYEKWRNALTSSIILD